MDIASLLMRALDDRGSAYLPYSFEGDFLPEERAVIEDAIRPHVPESVNARFNNWRISKFMDGYFCAIRASWDRGIGAKSAHEMAEKISRYYARR